MIEYLRGVVGRAWNVFRGGGDIDRMDISDDRYKYLVWALNKVVEDINRFPHGMTQILDHLYIGDMDDAVNITVLKQNGITHIINCAEMYVPTGPKKYGKDFKYIGFEAEDHEEYDMMTHFDDVYKFIEKARTSGGKAFIHCMMGINRSGVLAAAYYMLHQNVGPITAAKEIKDKRGILLSNRGFQRQLLEFANNKNMLALDEPNMVKYKL